jgi:IS30 family transposase
MIFYHVLLFFIQGRQRYPNLLTEEEHSAAKALITKTIPFKQCAAIHKRVYVKIRRYDIKCENMFNPLTGHTDELLSMRGHILPYREQVDEIVRKYRQQTKLCGARKLFQLINKTFGGITEQDIQKVINKDADQVKVKPAFKNRPPMRTVEAVCVMDRVQADLVNLDNISNDRSDFKYVVSVFDIFSRYLWLRPVKDKSSETVCQVLKNIFMEHGPPRVLQTDNGTEFKGAVKILSQQMKIRLIHGRPHHPHSQG